MRGHAIRKVEIDLIDIAPAPSFRRIITLDDRMRCRVEMLGCMAIGGIVAAADMTAGTAEAQMYPPGTGFETFFAAVSAGGDVCDRVVVGTGIGHCDSLLQIGLGSTLGALYYRHSRVGGNDGVGMWDVWHTPAAPASAGATEGGDGTRAHLCRGLGASMCDRRGSASSSAAGKAAFGPGLG